MCHLTRHRYQPMGQREACHRVRKRGRSGNVVHDRSHVGRQTALRNLASHRRLDELPLTTLRVTVWQL